MHCFQTGDLEGARAMYGRAIETDPRNHIPFANRAQVKFSTDQSLRTRSHFFPCVKPRSYFHFLLTITYARRSRKLGYNRAYRSSCSRGCSRRRLQTATLAWNLIPDTSRPCSEGDSILHPCKFCTNGRKRFFHRDRCLNWLTRKVELKPVYPQGLGSGINGGEGQGHS